MSIKDGTPENPLDMLAQRIIEDPKKQTLTFTTRDDLLKGATIKNLKMVKCRYRLGMHAHKVVTS